MLSSIFFAPKNGSVCALSLQPGTAQWLAIVLRRHFQFPTPLEIDLICLYGQKLIADFEFFANKAISGSFGVKNSQNFLKIAKKFLTVPKFAKN